MAGNTTSNTTALVRAEVYSDLILDIIEDGLLPEGLHRDVTDFADGTTLNIPTFGDVILRDLTEDEDTPVDALDTGTVTLNITEHVGAGSSLTDEFKENSYQAAEFDAAIVPKHARAIKKRYETNLLATGPSAQVAADANAINGYAHRFVASGVNQIMDLQDLIYLKLAFDKAEVPDDGRILIVDGTVEASFNSLTNLVNVSNNPQFEGIIESGLAKQMKFIKNIYGFDIMVSNRLQEVNNETVDTSIITVPAPSSSATVTSGVANVAMCIVDDMTTPLMGAWRRQIRFEGERNVAKRRDEFYTSGRWGFGVQRLQTLGVLLSNRTAY